MVVTDMHHLICAGAVCNCILPESLKINAVCHDPDGQAEDSEKRRLTGAFSCFSSISLCQRHFSASSLFLRSPAKGTSWDTKQSSSARLKKSWELRYPVHCISLIEAPRFFFNHQQPLLRKDTKVFTRWCSHVSSVGSSCALKSVQSMCRSYS
jgi:hypothetical protein